MIELKRLNHYSSVEDKMNCILKCCKALIEILSKKREEAAVSADTMIPNLTFIVLKSQVPYLITNIQYLTRYSSPASQSESLYYFTQLVSVVYFIEILDANSLTIDPSVYER